MTDEKYMQRALELAYTAEADGEVPVGALIVLGDEVIGQGWNRPLQSHDCSAHAEIIALRQACQHQKNYRLLGATLYVTLEPCAMCACAMLHARLKRCVFAAFDPKAGSCGSVINLFEDYAWNHKIDYQGGILAKPCSKLLKDFFKARR